MKFGFLFLFLICDEKEKEIVPGSLMKALIRPGGGDSRPSDGDQVFICLFIHFALVVLDYSF